MMRARDPVAVTDDDDHNDNDDVRSSPALSGVEGTGLVGLYGRPYLSLERYVDVAALDALHDEICLALTQLPFEIYLEAVPSILLFPGISFGLGAAIGGRFYF